MLLVKDREVSKVQEQLLAMQEEGRKENAALEVAEQHFRAVSAGLSTNEDGEEATLAGQMMTCKNEISKADTEAKQVRNQPGWGGGLGQAPPPEPQQEPATKERPSHSSQL